MNRSRLDIEYSFLAGGGGPPGLFEKVAHRGTFIEQTQLAVGVLRIARIAENPTVQKCWERSKETIRRYNVERRSAIGRVRLHRVRYTYFGGRPPREIQYIWTSISLQIDWNRP